MRVSISAVCFVCVLWSLATRAANWPQFQADAVRSAYTSEELPDVLTLAWMYEARHAPQPAWPGEDTRMSFDYAYHPVIAGGLLFFGSSADCKVYALDAVSGQERWGFFTGAPVRFAPAVWKDRVFAISDDGYLYCLSLEQGRLLWKVRGGPGDEMVLGNDRMISRWPARGGLAVADGTIYFGAGIWPSEGIYLHAIDAETGRARWVSDQAGGMEMAQPHSTAWAKSGISAQGYLAVSPAKLLVPTGRAVPAVFSRESGAFDYFYLQSNQKRGGSPVAVAEPYYFNAGYLYDIASGALAVPLEAQAVAVTPNDIVCITEHQLKVLNRDQLAVERESVDAKGKTLKKRYPGKPSWTLEMPSSLAQSLIVAGHTAVAGRLDGGIVAVDLLSKEISWQGEVHGRPLGLAAAGGRLYVSTDQGRIYCFAASTPKAQILRKAANREVRLVRDQSIATAAEEILHKSHATKGYCLDLGCVSGDLVYELAIKSGLQIYAISPDADLVRAAREKLDAAGLYGVRATVHLGDPAKTPYPPYFADLIVSERAASEGEPVVIGEEINRLLRPYGGAAWLGRRGAMQHVVRGPLQGAAAWTHQYADPANTSISEDALVEAPLKMLWFNDNGLAMPNRHGHGPAPLCADGRLFVEGNHGLRAVDAYNGRTLWDYPLPDILIPYDQEHALGATVTGSNFCVGGEAVYVAAGTRCLRIDAATGRLLAEFKAPDTPEGTPGLWGYLAYEDGTLFGTVVNTEHLVRTAYKEADMDRLYSESSQLFALEAQSGELKWDYHAKYSIRHNAIAVGGGRVFLIDRPLDAIDRADYDLERAKRRGVEPVTDLPVSPGTPEIVAFDFATGAVLWRNASDIYGTLLVLGVERGVLVMTYQHTRDKLESEVGGRMSAFRASDGARLWDTVTYPQEKPKPSSRLLLNGDTLYLEPNAFDLLTGRQFDFTLARSYGCGIMVGSTKLLVFRSATIGYLDLLHNAGTENYGGIRPGCWINAIPAGGLVLMPDVTSGCTCSYLNKAWVALMPAN